MERGENPLLFRSRKGNESPYEATGLNDREGGLIEHSSLENEFPGYCQCPEPEDRSFLKPR